MKVYRLSCANRQWSGWILEDLKTAIGAFIAERDWEQFHSPKNLAMALSVEVAEVVECTEGDEKRKPFYRRPRRSRNLRQIKGTTRRSKILSKSTLISHLINIATSILLGRRPAMSTYIVQLSTWVPGAGGLYSPRSREDEFSEVAPAYITRHHGCWGGL
jgi:hypothetical protein